MTERDRTLLVLLAAAAAITVYAQLPRGIGWPGIGTAKGESGTPTGAPKGKRPATTTPTGAPSGPRSPGKGLPGSGYVDVVLRPRSGR